MYNFTPLMSVCFRGYLTKGSKKDADQFRIKIVKKLLESGADASYTTPDTKMTSMHWACYNLDYAVVELLLRSGAPELSFSHMERLPIDVAGSSMAWRVVDVCLERYYYKVSGKSEPSADFISKSVTKPRSALAVALMAAKKLKEENEKILLVSKPLH